MNNYTPLEEWRPVLGIDFQFAVSSLGHIMRLENTGRYGRYKAGSLVNQFVSPLGYCYIHVSIDGKRKKPYVHTLVARAFLGLPPDKHEVNHIDCNKSNNAVDNLEYLTHKQNLRHSYNDIYMNRPSRRKITDSQIAGIIEMRKQGHLQREIAAVFGVSQPTVSKIVNGR